VSGAPAAPGELRQLALAGGPFEARHRARLGPAIELGDLAPARVPAELLSEVRAEWQARVRSEFRSIQIMTRFLAEVTGAGDPLDVYTTAVELCADEIRHAELCAAVCGRLAVPAPLPDPVALPDAPSFLASPFPERALATAITMLGVNETISTAIIGDLLERCDYEPIRAVLRATIADENTHGAFGWDYIRASLQRFDRESRPHWRRLAAQALAPHRVLAERALAALPPEQRTLEAFPETGRARFGLLSPVRQALLFERTFRTVLAPKLRELDLLAPGEDS
jgi:hypothetical protein